MPDARKSIQYPNCIVAYLDILGFKNLVLDESKCETIGAVLHLPYVFSGEDVATFFKLSSIQLSSISDSIVISIPAKKKNAMNKIVRMASVFSVSLLWGYGLLLRGAISVGPLYHDEQVVYGPALVKAYLLEQNAAIYPRILMEPTELEAAIQSCSDNSRRENREAFRLDQDERLYLDIFRHFHDAEKLAQCRAWVDRAQPQEQRVAEKYAWMRREIQRVQAAVFRDGKAPPAVRCI